MLQLCFMRSVNFCESHLEEKALTNNMIEERSSMKTTSCMTSKDAISCDNTTYELF